MKTCIALLAGMGMLASCLWVSSGHDADSTRAVTVFLTGREAGELKPCGCSSGQLGGLERRAALLERVPKTDRLILSTGSLVDTDSEQDMIKFPVFLQAYRILEYDVVNLTAHDLAIAAQTGAVDQIQGSAIQLISAESTDEKMPSTYERSFMLMDQKIRVKVVSLPARSPFEIGMSRTSEDGSILIRIFVLNSEDQARLDMLLQQAMPSDCIIIPVGLDEPKLMSDPNDGPLVLSIGHRGRYVGRLDITLAPQTRRPKLHFSSLPVSEELPNQPDLVTLYKDYQQIVSAGQLLERFPRVPLPDDSLSYVGSESCQQCHGYEYQKWSQSKHAHAFATLEKVGSHRDPECVTCHVVGMEYESGYVSATETPLLKEVGCEVCHGPGSEHIRTNGEVKTAAPQKVCLDCHTPEHSSGYAGHELEFLEKIRHWMEPR